VLYKGMIAAATTWK